MALGDQYKGGPQRIAHAPAVSGRYSLAHDVSLQPIESVRVAIPARHRRCCGATQQNLFDMPMASLAFSQSTTIIACNPGTRCFSFRISSPPCAPIPDSAVCCSVTEWVQLKPTICDWNAALSTTSTLRTGDPIRYVALILHLLFSSLVRTPLILLLPGIFTRSVHPKQRPATTIRFFGRVSRCNCNCTTIAFSITDNTISQNEDQEIRRRCGVGSHWQLCAIYHQPVNILYDRHVLRLPKLIDGVDDHRHQRCHRHLLSGVRDDGW